jgi:tRNA A-37 threonylcarbamoyl transferase component Bud32
MVLSTGSFVEELQLESFGLPDPSIPPLREKVYASLGVGEQASIQIMQGIAGGQNQGMWVLEDRQRTWILKLVGGKRKHPAIPTEGDQFAKIVKEHPSIRSDSGLAFPIKVIRCREAFGGGHNDLIAMMRAPGQSLDEAISEKWHAGKKKELMQMFHSLGRFLAGIHKRYNMQHGDFQPSNIFYDEDTGSFTLIDVGGMERAEGLQDSDVQHFSEALQNFARGLNAHELFANASCSFRAGYTEAKATR